MKILTFDIEEWFHLTNLDRINGIDQWDSLEVRIHKNMDRVLDMLEESNTSATFFIVGWIAQKYPEIVRKIAEKYEIGSHTMNHQTVWQQSRAEFKQEVYSSVKLLEDISGKKVRCFRAPAFSIRESELWAFEILQECGIEIDCSIFPSFRANGGMPSYKQIAPSWIEGNGFKLKEFPMSPISLFNKNIIYSGGGYFRLLPYSIIKEFTRQSDYVMTYIHPQDFDLGKPILEGLPLHRRFRSRVGLKGAESKFRQWLTDFDFVDIKTAEKAIDWSSEQTVYL